MAFLPLKYIYEKPFASNYANSLKKIIPSLDIGTFENEIYDHNWNNLELKDRMRHLSKLLHNYLDENFELATVQIIKLVAILEPKEYKYPALTFMFLPDYIESYGLKHFDIAMKSFESITEFSSCEFAVRPFIIQNQSKALGIMKTWSKHKNFHIRRLASEGCRPKLPWAMALKELQKDPTPILPILENLKTDKEDYVYRSVANNLNDISKTHPELVLKLANKWTNKTKTTDWLVKHALRTLLKAGNQEAMKIFGYGSLGNATIKSFELESNAVKIGNYLTFSFELQNKIFALNRLEYAIYFLKKNGSFTKKVFKISEKQYEQNSSSVLIKKHSFKEISTRTYHLGKHKVAIIVNGIELESKAFELLKH